MSAPPPIFSLAVRGFEVGFHCCCFAEVDGDRRFAAVVAEVGGYDRSDGVSRDALLNEAFCCCVAEIGDELRHIRLDELLDRRLADHAEIGEADAPGGEDAGKRMQKHAARADSVCHRAGVLATRAAEGAEHVIARVVAALD